MRIAILTNDAYPNPRGGVAVIVDEHATGLRRRSHEVEIFHAPTRFLRRGIFLRTVFHILDLLPRRDLVARITEFRPDILVTHNLTGCGFGTPHVLRGKGIPWVHVLHDVQLFEPSGRIIHGESFPALRNVWRQLWSVARRSAFGQPSSVLSPSRWLLDMHKRFGFFRNSDTRILPNPIPRFDAMPVPAPDSVVNRDDILYVGRLDEDKGVRVLIEAWENLGHDRPRLHLVGGGNLKSFIEQKSGSHLVFHGMKPRNELWDLYRPRPTVIIPSLVFENQPTVILEAVSFGCPVIASRVGGIPELLEGCDAVIIPPGDVEALSRAMRERFRHTSNERPAPNSEWIKRHDPDVVLDALEDVLKSNL